MSDYTADNPLIVNIHSHETIPVSSVSVYALDALGEVIKESGSDKPVTSITLFYVSGSEVWPSKTLKAFVSPERATNKDVTWNSSDDHYVKIVKSDSESAVIEVRNGYAKSSPKIVAITATSISNDKKSGSLEVRCVKI